MDAVGELEGTVSLHGGVHTRRWISMGDFMARLAVPSFYSATVSEQRHPATAITEVAPWRGILAVEPDLAVLNAKSVLLTQANYSVTLATNDSDLFSLQYSVIISVGDFSGLLPKSLESSGHAHGFSSWVRFQGCLRITSTMNRFAAHPILNRS